tara:strand:- start:801 stop:917 length:117 start_codon:yes stop_codon:yes gene_type:complete
MKLYELFITNLKWANQIILKINIGPSFKARKINSVFSK